MNTKKIVDKMTEDFSKNDLAQLGFYVNKYFETYLPEMLFDFQVEYSEILNDLVPKLNAAKISA